MKLPIYQIDAFADDVFPGLALPRHLTIPEEGVIHIWQFDIGSPDPPDSLLSKDEQLRAASFRFAEHRNRYINARITLRSLLGKYLEKDPQNLSIALEEYGKPYLKENSPSFNLSHSENTAIVAVASSGQIGVDVEVPGRKLNCLSLARRYFSEGERALLETAHPDRHENIFRKIWTAKESILKAIGTGLRVELKDMDTSPGVTQGTGRISLAVNAGADPSPYYFRLVWTDDSGTACVASGFDPVRIEFPVTRMSASSPRPPSRH